MENKLKSKDRVSWIDSLKGFTIITVIIGHCFDGYLKANTFPSCYDIFYNSKYFIYLFHMPLFFVISGITLHLAYIKNDNELKKDRYCSQILNLFLLYTVWALLLWVAKMMFSEYVNAAFGLGDLLKMFIAPLGNYWYLYVLCILYILVLCCRLYKFNKLILAGMTLLLNIGICYVYNYVDFIHYTVYRIFFNLFFLCFGMLIMSRPKIFENKIIAVISGAISVGLLIAFYAYGYDIFANVVLRTVIALSMSVVFLWLFKNVNLLNNRFFKLCGKYCIYIYLMHFYITAGNRKILPMFGITNPYVALVVNAISALFISLIVAIILSKIPISDILFRPVNFLKRIKKEKKL